MEAAMKATARAVLVLFMSLTAGLAACGSGGAGAGSGDDAIRTLGATAISSDYNEAYWGEQRRSDPDLWARATTYCDGRDGNQYPNCRPVLSLLVLERTLERPTTTSPGFDGSMDMGERRDAAESRLDSLATPQ
jgi:hypothetical protein